jgi:FKBP-type peptidyl-prolyl cis-trans isomerase
MSRRRWCIIGSLGLVLGGCEEPEQVVRVTPPGAVIPRTPPPGDDVAQALGEAIAAGSSATMEVRSKPPEYTPAEPTEPGETKTTKNGVRYETLKPGTGEAIRPGQVARVHYEGKLEDGSVFDSSRRKGQPVSFTIGTGGLIKGWEEGIPGMRVGETRRLIIPPALGYGDQEHARIPPNSTLIFEVELLGIN